MAFDRTLELPSLLTFRHRPRYSGPLALAELGQGWFYPVSSRGFEVFPTKNAFRRQTLLKEEPLLMVLNPLSDRDLNAQLISPPVAHLLR
jgi:hypothetical protein